MLKCCRKEEKNEAADGIKAAGPSEQQLSKCTVATRLRRPRRIIIHDAAHPDPPFKLCDTANFPTNSPYRANLDKLLSSLSTYQSVPKFYNTSLGTDPYRLYNLFMCYDYANNDKCNTCLQVALQDIQKLCLYKFDAVVWNEDCLFRYSTENFFGKLNVTGNIPLDNIRNVSDPERYRSVVNNTLYNLTKIAAFDPSADMHFAGSTPYMENSMNITALHAFVQCSKDLSPNDCYACLETAINQILDLYYSRGARLLSRSCFLRYELYNFVEGTDQDVVPKPGHSIKKWMIPVLTIGSVTLALTVGYFIYCLVPRNPTRNRESKILGDQTTYQQDNNLDFQNHITRGGMDNLDPKEYPFIEIDTIKEATDNFSDSNKLGEGGFGPVFKGVLANGEEIAVKRLSTNSEQGSDEFINEVMLIHKLQHKNLVRLLGFCVHEEEKLLVYEYMPNSSLDGFLFDPRKHARLNWTTRLDIINGIARGMLYLHQDSRLNIIHRDLKPSNVLLDANMNPKISDFGMARIFGGPDGEANTAKIVGTYGYMAPEFAMEGLYSIKSDVFSFGVLLLEIISGRRNAGFHLTKCAPSLLAYAWKLWDEGKGLELMDPLLTDSCSHNEFLRCMHIGLLCVQEDAQDRPLMSYVVVMLNSQSVSLSQPEQPAFFVAKFTDHERETCYNNMSISGLTISDQIPR
ncbi:Cysteine-rich receptor-like protein kinase 10 [Forsythia ovata]|uniref:non-specific serine/threonine protein kinase n=1 Tax=Forsythia ovata TaxID=205694 RepID=A0ABD1S3P7_9LAMI